jgi:hypothetical protein
MIQTPLGLKQRTPARPSDIHRERCLWVVIMRNKQIVWKVREAAWGTPRIPG